MCSIFLKSYLGSVYSWCWSTIVSLQWRRCSCSIVATSCVFSSVYWYWWVYRCKIACWTWQSPSEWYRPFSEEFYWGLSIKGQRPMLPLVVNSESFAFMIRQHGYDGFQLVKVRLVIGNMNANVIDSLFLQCWCFAQGQNYPISKL